MIPDLWTDPTADPKHQQFYGRNKTATLVYQRFTHIYKHH